MRSLFSMDKSRIFTSLYVQMTIVITAFLIMGVSSFFFARSRELKHMENDVRNAAMIAETEIASLLISHESFFSNFSETILSMVINDENTAVISRYITDMHNYLLKNDEQTAGFVNLYAYLYREGGVFLSGREITLPADFNAQERLWYQSAASADGRIVLTDPYDDLVTEKKIFTFTRQITDNTGTPHGVICIDIDIGNIFNKVVNIHLTPNSYGFLVNDRLTILAHPLSYLTGRSLSIAESSIFFNAQEFIQSRININRRVNNFRFEKSFAFFKQIKYGWFLGIVVPVYEYNRDIYFLAAFLFFTGSILALGLCAMLHQIAQAKKRADLRNKQKSNFLATISHEIRTPLNAILGMTEIQIHDTSHTQAAVDAFLKINNSGNLLLNIINDILDLSKIESGNLELNPVKYEVASLINDVVQLNNIRFESKPLEFKLLVDEATPSVLVGDELRIKQILNNVLSNAFKYTESGSVTFSVAAECVGRGGGILVTLIFQVTDTGIGMTQDQIDKMFDDYARFNLEANRTSDGSGLGMTITRNLINLMQGKINIKSAPGEGTEVTIRLPQKTDGVGISGILGKEMAENLQKFRQGDTITRKRTPVTHEYMPYGSVLIVDDVETNLYVARGLMAPYGLKIDLATSGIEAIEKIKGGEVYDIIFMDHMMPKMDGMEAAKIIRNLGYTHPIVALTANALAGQAEIFLKNGFDGFISKPIDIRQLNISLNRLIRDKQPAEVIEAANKEKKENGNKQIISGKEVDSQLAEIFARDAQKAFTVIESVFNKNFKDESDLKSYLINVHAMKSALANVGEHEISEKASKLEKEGRDKNIDFLVSETQEFLNNLRIIIDKIKPKNEEEEPLNDTDEALAYLSEKLLIIKEACDMMEKKSIKKTLNEIREKKWSHDVKELLNSVSEHLLHSEFDSIVSDIEKYIK